MVGGNLQIGRFYGAAQVTQPSPGLVNGPALQTVLLWEALQSYIAKEIDASFHNRRVDYWLALVQLPEKFE